MGLKRLILYKKHIILYFYKKHFYLPTFDFVPIGSKKLRTSQVLCSVVGPVPEWVGLLLSALSCLSWLSEITLTGTFFPLRLLCLWLFRKNSQLIDLSHLMQWTFRRLFRALFICLSLPIRPSYVNTQYCY